MSEHCTCDTYTGSERNARGEKVCERCGKVLTGGVAAPTSNPSTAGLRQEAVVTARKDGHSIDVPSSTPCDDCGDPSTWLTNDGEGTEMVLCDDCHDSRYRPGSEG